MTFLSRPNDDTLANTPTITKSPAAVHATRAQGRRRLHAKSPHETPETSQDHLGTICILQRHLITGPTTGRMICTGRLKHPSSHSHIR
eukprot:12429045-Karenia_brevis.AAC.1